MLDRKTMEQIQQAVKKINKEKDLNYRTELMIDSKEFYRNLINEALDDLFAEVILLPDTRKINFDDLSEP